jgi:hypothetical protein
MPSVQIMPPISMQVISLLDTFGASAQAFNDNGVTYYAWGQHIYDDAGDNTGQYGVHGTAQAVLGLATGIRILPSNSRHHRYLDGGLRWLRRSLTSPKKPVDLHKTVKIGELVTALYACKSAEQREEALSVLQAGWNPDVGGWSFDLAERSQPSVVPSLFGLRALVQCHGPGHDLLPQIVPTIRFCIDHLPDESQEDKRRACIYMLARAVAECSDFRSSQAGLLDEVHSLLREDDPSAIPLLRVTTFDYRIKEHGTEATAFCTIQTGLLQVWLYLWARKNGVSLRASPVIQSAAIAQFLQSISTALPFSLVESCSVAIQICVAFPSLLEDAGQSGSSPTALVAPATRSIDPLMNTDTRGRLYVQLLANEGVKNVRILTPLTGGWSDAYLDLCELTDRNDAVMVPQVLKLTTPEDVERETNGAKDAANYIDTIHRVSLLSHYVSEDQKHGVIRFEYAGGTLRRRGVLPFLDFLNTAGDVTEVVDAIREHFDSGLRQMYVNRKPKSASLSELLQFFEDARGGTFWSSITQGLENLMQEGLVQGYEERKTRLFLRIPFTMVTNLFHDSPEFAAKWKAPFPSMETPKAHGDHNPRNLLMVQEKEKSPFRPVLIDFHRFGGPMPLALDFARLEVGIQIKGLRSTISESASDDVIAANLRDYERAVHAKLDIRETLGETSVGFKGTRSLARVAKVKAAIRKCFANVSGQSNDYAQSYFAVLMLCYLSYLRPFYYDKLTVEQRTYALYLAAQIFEQHF